MSANFVFVRYNLLTTDTFILCKNYAKLSPSCKLLDILTSYLWINHHVPELQNSYEDWLKSHAAFSPKLRQHSRHFLTTILDRSRSLNQGPPRILIGYDGINANVIGQNNPGKSFYWIKFQSVKQEGAGLKDRHCLCLIFKTEKKKKIFKLFTFTNGIYSFYNTTHQYKLHKSVIGFEFSQYIFTKITEKYFVDSISTEGIILLGFNIKFKGKGKVSRFNY